MHAPTASEIGSVAQEFAPAEEPHCSPMSFGQLRVWFVEQLAMGAAVNNLFFAVRLSGELHDGKPVQVIGRARAPALTLIDLSKRPTPDLTQEAYAVAHREVNKPFDLTRGPLLRLVLLRLAPQNHIMLATLHHIICDGWSLGLFADELATCYAAFRSGAIPAL